MSDITARIPATVPTSPPLADERIAQVFNWILSGGSEQEIVEAARHNWPDADAMPLIITAMERIAASASAEKDTIHGFCIEATRFVYQKALDAGDWSTALRAIKQLHAFAA